MEDVELPLPTTPLKRRNSEIEYLRIYRNRGRLEETVHWLDGTNLMSGWMERTQTRRQSPILSPTCASRDRNLQAAAVPGSHHKTLG